MALGVVSERFRLVCLLIAKNASSTLRQEIKRLDPSSREIVTGGIGANLRQGCTTFCFLRDPVSRVLSAYQEISMRLDGAAPPTPGLAFSQLPDGPERFEAFLDRIEKGPWDGHVRSQTTHLGDHSIDLWGRVETLQRDLETVYELLELGPCPALPARRSRAGRATDYDYDKYLLSEEELTPETTARIRQIYHEDFELLGSLEELPRLCQDGSLRGRIPECFISPVEGSIAVSSNSDPGKSKSRNGESASLFDDLGPKGGEALLRIFGLVNRKHDDCVVLRLGSRGFFAELTTVARAMAYAWCHGRQLLLDSSAFSYRRDQGWIDYFEPFCARPDEVDGGRIRETIDFHADSASGRRLIAFMPEKIEIGSVLLGSWQEILSTFSAIIFRPNAHCRAEITRLVKDLELPENFAAIHLRRGDKVGDEDIHFPCGLYLDQLEPLGAELCLFVMSDAHRAIEEVRKELAVRQHACRVVTLCPEQPRGFDVWALRRGEPFMVGAGAQSRQAASRNYTFTETIRLLAETVVAARACRFVSTARSNVGRTVGFLRRDQTACRLLTQGEVAAWSVAHSAAGRAVAGSPTSVVESIGSPPEGRLTRISDTPLSIHPMEIVSQNGDDYHLFLDIFVHPSRRKIVAVAPHYGEDWNPAEHGIDFGRIDLYLESHHLIRGRYIPHRLDSWEPCVLFDFEDPLLEARLRELDEVSVTIVAGPHQQEFMLKTQAEPAYDVALSLVVKNENRWIGAFLEYYLTCLEADHVFVYDNGTTEYEELLAVLRPYRERGQVTYIPWNYRWRNRKRAAMIAQPPQQSHSLNCFANCHWIGFFDVDELLRLPDKTLPEFLAPFAGAAVDGLSFGLRWFDYRGPLSLDEVGDPALTFVHRRRDPLGRKRQKLIVAPRDVRFLRLHWLEEGKRELPIDDSEIFFHHYTFRPQRFEQDREIDDDTVVDDYMLRFSKQLSGLVPPLRSPSLVAPVTPETHVHGSRAQCGQDVFVLSLFPERQGTFVDIGCGDPFDINNTARLEENGWSGLSVDVADLAADWRSRNTAFMRVDALEGDLEALFDSHGLPAVVDYLSIDLEGEGNRYRALARVLDGHRTFRVITIEHDVYKGYHESERAQQRKLLQAAGYELVCADVSAENEIPFEDWWVHPRLIGPERYGRFRSRGINFRRIFDQAGVELSRRSRKPTTQQEWIRHIVSAFEGAEAESSRLSGEVLTVPGLCGTYNRHFFNRLCDLNDGRYLEIGSHAGASLCAAMYENRGSAVCIDDWSQFNGNRADLEYNLRRFTAGSDVQVIEGDCFEIDPSTLGPFDVFYYDGDHRQESHYRAIERYAGTLADLAVLVVDDWNWERVRGGTREALRDLSIPILFEREILLPDHDLVDMPRHPGRHTWWNGICVMLLAPGEGRGVAPPEAGR